MPPSNRDSDLLAIQFSIPVPFTWDNEGDLTAVRGGNIVCRTLEWTQGHPVIEDDDIDEASDFDFWFYNDSAGTSVLSFGTLPFMADDPNFEIGDQTLAEIVTLANFVDEGDGTGSIDVAVDPSGITDAEIDADFDIYVRATAYQPDNVGETFSTDSRRSDVIHVSISDSDTAGAAPVIASENISWTGRVGVSFSRTVFATSESDVTWSEQVVATLPPGLALNTSTGVVSGMPTVAGTTTVVIVATNDHGTDTVSIKFTIRPSMENDIPVYNRGTSSFSKRESVRGEISARNRSLANQLRRRR